MGDNSPERKPEEQFPLLKVDGGGDSSTTQTAPPAWGVQCSKKNTFCFRWPEWISACWMTLILFGISFLVFYALGMGAYRRQKFIFVKCNSSKPATKVFYHHLVPNSAEVPFLQHSEYLSNMATQYPNLHFIVYYLIDDSRTTPDRYFINKLIPTYNFAYKMDENCKQAMVEFKKRFPNVTFFIMPLTKYMSETPLRYRWRSTPSSYLPFYARTFSVWENGGVGMDLAFHSFFEESLIDSRKAAILRQHNDGINPEAYANALNRIDKEEDNAMFTLFYGLINRFLNETRSFINRTLTYTPPETKSDVLLRTHRAKREVEDLVIKTTTQPIIAPTNNSKHDSNLLDLIKSSLEQSNPLLQPHYNNSKNLTEAPQVIFFDFHIFSDSVGPSYFIDRNESVRSAPIAPTLERDRSVIEKRLLGSQILSMDTEGRFIAASSRLHPLLGHIVSNGCQRVSPKFTIQDAILSQCSGKHRKDAYCNNVYIL